MKALIDTNVILDALMRREPWYNDAEDILIAAARGEEVFITASSVTDIYYIAKKYCPDKSLAKEILLNVLGLVHAIDVSHADCVSAFNLEFTDYEDALQAQCALKSKMDVIVTRNRGNFKHSPVKIVSPGEYLNSIAN